MLTIEQIKWVPYAEATHVVTGYFVNEYSNNNGGILSTARCVEEAEEYAAVYIAAGYHDVKVSESEWKEDKTFC